MKIPKGRLPHPQVFKMNPSIGLPQGQRSDFRRRIRGGAGFHVKDFGTHYEAHIDRVHPEVDVVEHLRRDAPGTFVGGGVTLGAALGAAIGRSPKAALAGAAIGGVLAALMTSTNQ